MMEKLLLGLSALISVVGTTWALAATAYFEYSGIAHQAMIACGLLAAFIVAAGRTNAWLSG